MSLIDPEPGSSLVADRPRWPSFYSPVQLLSSGSWNLKFHEYDRKPPTKNVQVLLDYLDSHADPIFWR